MPRTVSRSAVVAGLVVSAMLLAASSTARAADVDRADPKSTAKAVLTAYKAKDLNALAELSTETNKKFFKEIAEQGEKHPRYNSIFGGFRWEAVQKWGGGDLTDVRYRGRNSMLKLSEGEAGKLVVVRLRKEGDKWSFDDIVNIDAKAYDEAAKTPE